MNKFQKRKNNLKKYKMFLSNDKINEIIYNDKQYTNFLKYMNVCENTAEELMETLLK
jgi:hypothetical protein